MRIPGVWRIWLATGALCALGFGAVATVPQIYICCSPSGSILPGESVVKPGPVIIKPPLTFARDSQGRMQLGVSLPAPFTDCTTDANGNSFCPHLLSAIGPGLQPDGAGTIIINYATNPPTIGIATGVVWTLTGANTPTGYTDMRDGMLSLPKRRIADLPDPASNTDKVWMILDGSTPCDATTGGGTTRVLVTSDGSAWVPLNCR